MSTLTQIQSAALALPEEEQAALLRFLARRVRGGSPVRKGRRRLKAASRLPLEGLPATLSTGTKEKVRDLIARRHASNR